MKTKISQNNIVKNIVDDILKLENKQRIQLLQRFFQTGPGQYAEGDVFLGIYVPVLRKVVVRYQKEFLKLEIGESLKILQKLLDNKYHEVRFVALCLLVFLYKNAEKMAAPAARPTNSAEKNKYVQMAPAQPAPKIRKQIFEFYIKNISKNINNWDLVDVSCEHIVGAYAFTNKNFKILEKLTKSKNLWERRVGIVSNLYFLRRDSDEFLYKLLPILREEKHHLMWKASGWMLREAGKRVSRGRLVDYLIANYQLMPSVMRSYACEKLNIVEKTKIIHSPL